VAQTWFSRFSRHISNPSSKIEEIFTPNGFWRDLVALSPDIRTLHPRSSIQVFLNGHSSSMRPNNFKFGTSVKGRTIVNQFTTIQGTFTFQTCVGHCSGVFSLVPTLSGQWKALSIVVALDKLHGAAAKFSENITIGPMTILHADVTGFPDRKPVVVVIGAGQAGLAVAARLENLYIPTIVVECRARIGDRWRTRYDSLNINTPRNFSHLPFVPFPQDWPMFPSSKSVADHMEAYPQVLGLCVLTSANVVRTTYHDGNKGIWTLLIRLGNGSIVTVQAKHIVVASGVDTLAGSEPRVPDIPKSSVFTGKTLHSTQFDNGKEWAGKKTVVIGAGCSGHDIAQELHRQGAETVTLVQRSSTAVVSREMLLSLFPGQEYLYIGDHQPPTAVADRLFLSFPIPVTRSLQHENMNSKSFIDRELIGNLRQKGFLIPDENDNFFERLMIRRGGYYIDQGCASLIINDQIKVVGGIPIAEYTPYGLLFADGSEVQADLIVYATGFRKESLIEKSSKLLGYDLRDKVDEVGGWDTEFEMSGIWRPTGHKGLWFAGGDLFTCRFYSSLLAMLIKAEE
ncbi:putative dimethylaniline monooxygenase (N-oxide-forming), partial [Ramaria rubella]